MSGHTTTVYSWNKPFLALTTGSHPLLSQPAPTTEDSPQACSAKGNLPPCLSGLAVCYFLCKIWIKTEKKQKSISDIVSLGNMCWRLSFTRQKQANVSKSSSGYSGSEAGLPMLEGTSVLTLTSCMIWVKLPPLMMPQFLHMKNGDNRGFHLLELLLVHTKHLEQCVAHSEHISRYYLPLLEYIL